MKIIIISISPNKYSRTLKRYLECIPLDNYLCVKCGATYEQIG